MKKFLAMIMSMALLVTMSVTVFAAENPATNVGGDTGISVTGTYVSSDVNAKVSVTVAWESMSFTYNAATVGEWDPTDHSYSNGTDAGWAESGNKITVTNHSNVDVTAAFSFKAAVGLTLTGTFVGTSSVGNAAITENAVTLKAGVLNAYENADKVEAKFSFGADEFLPEDWTAGNEIGTVTVSISTTANSTT